MTPRDLHIEATVELSTMLLPVMTVMMLMMVSTMLLVVMMVIVLMLFTL